MPKRDEAKLDASGAPINEDSLENAMVNAGLRADPAPETTALEDVESVGPADTGDDDEESETDSREQRSAPVSPRSVPAPRSKTGR